MSDSQPIGPWVYVISLVEKSLAFECFFRELKPFHENSTIIFLHPAPPVLMNVCEGYGYKVIWIKYSGKKNLLSAFMKMLLCLMKIKPSLIHTHLFDASLIGLTAARLLGIKYRIHTRHHASHHHIYFPHAIKYDLWINKMSTKIFAISANNKQILVEKEHVNPDKVKIVHHGFEIDFFKNVSNDRVQKLKDKYLISGKFPVIGMVSRYTHWKGIQYVIPAFGLFLRDYPNAVLILANANGDYKNEISLLLKEIPEDSYREITFENDSPALFHLMDMFIHVPIDDHSEAFGQVYIEAMASALPCIFTKSGIANEFVNDQNALVVPYCNTESILMAMKYVLNNPEKMKEISEMGYKDVLKLFNIDIMIQTTLKNYEG